MPWKRNDNVPVGKVWRKFTKERPGDTSLNFIIKDVTENEREKCVQFFRERFLKDEPLCEVLEISKDRDSVATILSNWREDMKQNLTVACYLDEGNGNPGMMVGALICVVNCKEDGRELDFEKIKGDIWREQLLPVLYHLESAKDVFSLYKVDKVLAINLIVTDSSYRGCNVGTELFNIAEQLAKVFSIKLVTSVVTALASQHIAEKCKFKTIFELPYTHFLERGIDVTKTASKTGRLVVKLV